MDYGVYSIREKLCLSDNEFNEYFVSLASKLNDAVIIENLPPRTFDDFMPSSNLGSMFMSECTQYEVSKIISELKNGKSSDLPISVIKKTSDIISPILAMHLFQLPNEHRKISG